MFKRHVINPSSYVRGLFLSTILVSVLAGPLVSQETGSIQGSVTSALDNGPLSDVDILLEGSGRRALTNRTAGFMFLELAAGSYVIVAERVA